MLVPVAHLAALPPPLTEFLSNHSWIAPTVALIAVILLGFMIRKLVRTFTQVLAIKGRAAEIRKTLAGSKIGLAFLIPGARGTAVEIHNRSSIPFAVTSVLLTKKRGETPLKLAYAGQVSPPRSLPKITELHQGAAVLQPGATFTFTHPTNAIFTLEEPETFTIAISVQFKVGNEIRTLKHLSPPKKKAAIESW